MLSLLLQQTYDNEEVNSTNRWRLNSKSSKTSFRGFELKTMLHFRFRIWHFFLITTFLAVCLFVVNSIYQRVIVYSTIRLTVEGLLESGGAVENGDSEGGVEPARRMIAVLEMADPTTLEEITIADARIWNSAIGEQILIIDWVFKGEIQALAGVQLTYDDGTVTSFGRRYLDSDPCFGYCFQTLLLLKSDPQEKKHITGVRLLKLCGEKSNLVEVRGERSCGRPQIL